MAWRTSQRLGEHSLASYADAGSRRFLALFLIALLRVKTINLMELATGFRNHAKTDSNYKRLQRFFRHFDLDYQQMARVLVALMDIPQPWILSIEWLRPRLANAPNGLLG